MTNTQSMRSTSAFSLVELSIVLVILGLLVGGVLSGQSLIRAAELRSVTSEYSRYTTAIGAFRDKYFAMPGDMSNAATFWTTTTSGDGDGQIDGTATATTNETGLAWVHLSLAQLVEGSYTSGIWTDATPTLGTEAAKAKLSNAGWFFRYEGTVDNDDATATGAANNVFYEGNYGNTLILMSANILSVPVVGSGVLKTEEAWNIDTKFDDAKPATGSVRALEIQGDATAGSGCGNADGSTSATAVGVAYDLANTSATACTLVFKTGY